MNSLEFCTMDSLQDRMRTILLEDQVDLTPSEIARIAGVSKGLVSQWMNGPAKTMSYEAAVKLQRRFGYTLDWLMSGKPPRYPPNTGAGPEVKGKVPLISWVQAGAFEAVVDNFQPGEAEEWIPTTVPIRQHTYALRVRGDSMTNPSGLDPTFPDGSIIIIEPDAVEEAPAMVGRFVIAKRTSDDEVTFKQLVKDSGQFFLKPLNPQYPTIELMDGDTFCGVVREKAMRFF